MTSGVPAMVRSTSYESMVDKGKSRAGDSVTRWQKLDIVLFGFGFE